MHHLLVNHTTSFLNQSPIKPSLSNSNKKKNSSSTTGNNSTSILYTSTPTSTSISNSHSKSGPTTLTTPMKIQNSPATSTISNLTLNNNNTSNKNATTNSNNNSTGGGGGSSTVSTIPQIPPEQVVALVSQCNWVDQTIWASRQLLGGQAVNGLCGRPPPCNVSKSNGHDKMSNPESPR